MDLDPQLLRRLRAEAQRRGIAFKSLLTEVLSEGLDGLRTRRVSRYRSRVYAMGTPRAALDKALSLSSALEDEEISRKLALRK